jgi:hypothetical protein
MDIGKKIRDGLIGVRFWAAIAGGPKRSQPPASVQFSWPARAAYAERVPRDGCPVCTTPAFRVRCGGTFGTCPMLRKPDADQCDGAAGGRQPRTGPDQPVSPPVVPDGEAPQPGQEPGFALPRAAGFVLWAGALAKFALQAATWWRHAK